MIVKFLAFNEGYSEIIHSIMSFIPGQDTLLFLWNSTGTVSLLRYSWKSKSKLRACQMCPAGSWHTMLVQCLKRNHVYIDVIMGTMASQIPSLTIFLLNRIDQRKHQSSTSLAFVWGIHRWPVNSPHKGPVTRKIFPFDGVIMCACKMVAKHRPLCSDLNF